MIRVGLIGAGANTRSRHIPGLRALAGVEIVAVCNRRPESTAQIASEFGIPRTFGHWQDLVADRTIDAIVIGTWPYLHAPITLAALKAGKHVLTEARMALNAAEAHAMLAEAKKHPGLVAQIVPSPFGLKGDGVMKHLLASAQLGELREVSVVHRTPALADPHAPLHWRQDAALSGLNMLTLGIMHETLTRWIPQPKRVLAQVHAFTTERIEPTSGARVAVGTPDSVQVLTVLPGGARGIYQLSGVTPFGQEASIKLYFTQGMISYDLTTDTIRMMCQADHGSLDQVPIPADAAGWRVEAEFIEAIRDKKPVRFTDFTAGVAYMEFTEAVARSAATGHAVTLPLE